MTHQVLEGYIWWDGYHLTKEEFRKRLGLDKKSTQKENDENRSFLFDLTN